MNENEQSLMMSPYGDFLGIQFGELTAGRAICSVKLMDHHLNNGGRVHGGVLTSLADTAAGAAVRTMRPADKSSATTDLHIAFIRPPLGDFLVADARVIHAGNALIRTEITVCSDDKLVARANATFMLVSQLSKT
ncbi:MAG TPA: phenylacetic acid degradation protein [Gammaproteobacteria bacterium]|nr:phenylacetic acid degradation protein [Gammaproteobacteria bacterium]